MHIHGHRQQCEQCGEGHGEGRCALWRYGGGRQEMGTSLIVSTVEKRKRSKLMDSFRSFGIWIIGFQK